MSTTPKELNPKDASEAMIAENQKRIDRSIHARAGSKTESDNFRGVVSNMLNEAAKAGKLVKRGERLNAVWSLPEPEPGAKVASLHAFQPGDQPGE